MAYYQGPRMIVLPQDTYEEQQPCQTHLKAKEHTSKNIQIFSLHNYLQEL